MEKILSLSEAKMKLNRLVEDIRQQDCEFIITKNGSPVAVLVPSSLYDGWKETREIQGDPEFVKEIRKGIAKLRKKGKRYAFEDVFNEPLT